MRWFTKIFVMQTCRIARRKYFSLICFCGLVLYCIQVFVPEREGRYYYMFNEGCKIPFMEIYDEELYKNSVDPYYYIKTCTNLTMLFNNNSHIWININPKSNIVRDSVHCCFQPFERPNTVEDINAPEKDRKVQYEPCKNFSDYIEVSSEFVKVLCKYKLLNGTTKDYKQFFAFTPLKNTTASPADAKKLPSTLTQGYNVVILGFSGMSRMNFYRTMPQTFDYLGSKGSIELQGYHKVGGNKFINMMPMLLGQIEKEMRKTCWPHLGAHYDNCPFIWNLYQNASYLTALGDDYPFFSLFNFNRHGFIRTPTDYYLYPFMREAMSKDDHEKNRCNECIGNRFVFEVFLDYIGNLTSTLRHAKLFGFFWETCMSYDILTMPAIMDNGYFNLLKNMFDSGYLNDTILIITSNSGTRWGRVRFTNRGKIEELLPVMQILTPQSFRIKYKLAYENLILNMYRLTSPFDVYETLKDLTDLRTIENTNIKLRTEDSYGSNRGISLFLPIPDNRTCADLGIEDHHCVCDRIGKSIKTNSTIALDAGKYIVEYLNNLLQEYDYCAMIQLHTILQITKFVTRSSENFIIVVVLEPESIQKSDIKNLIELEATLRYDGNWHLVGELHRTNALGYESQCLPPTHKYHQLCYCYPKIFL